MTLEVTWLLALRAALLLAAFSGFAWALLSARRDMRVGFNELATRHAEAMAEIQRLAEKISELNEQVRELQLPAPMVTPRLAPVAVPVSVAPSGARGYEMAIRMARNGASAEEIVTSCGTTRAEARLLRRLHCAHGADAA